MSAPRTLPLGTRVRDTLTPREGEIVDRTEVDDDGDFRVAWDGDDTYSYANHKDLEVLPAPGAPVVPVGTVLGTATVSLVVDGPLVIAAGGKGSLPVRLVFEEVAPS